LLKEIQNDILMLSVIIDEIKLKADKDRLILSGINFTVPQNSILTIAGKNGSGKSTLLLTIPALLNKKFYSVSGKILFEGKDILSAGNDERERIRRNKIRYVMQDSANSFNPLKKFRYYFEDILKDRASQKDAADLLDYFMLPGIDKLYNLYPHEVSGGMAQRIGFILAFLSKPEILLLDEPTSGIDSPVANLLLLKLKEFASNRNNCVILVTHDILFAEKVSDRIAVLNDGRLSELYPASKFLQNNSLFSSSYKDNLDEYTA